MRKTVINCHVWNIGLQNYTEKVPCAVLLKYLDTFVFNIFSVFNTLYLHITSDIGNFYLQQEQLGKSQLATSTFKCRGSTAAVLITTYFDFDAFSLTYFVNFWPIPYYKSTCKVYPLRIEINSIICKRRFCHTALVKPQSHGQTHHRDLFIRKDSKYEFEHCENVSFVNLLSAVLPSYRNQ